MKKIYISLILSVFLILFLSACSGVKFSEAPVNEPLPDALKNRTLYPAGVAGYDFEDLVGNIISVESNKKPIRVGIIRPNNFTPEVIPIKEPNNYYKSRIQKGAEINGSYLAFAADFSGEQMAELILSDISRSSISFSEQSVWDTVVSKAIKWVIDHPIKDTTTKRLWIKSAVLSRRIYSSYTDINANASGVVGETVGVKTGVYNKSEHEQVSVILAFDYFDIDKLVNEIEKEKKENKNFLFDYKSEKDFDKLLERVRYKIPLEGEIILNE